MSRWTNRGWREVDVTGFEFGDGHAARGEAQQADDVAGPALYTMAWVVGSLRQAGHSAAEVQLSGLAAEDAWDPQIMMAGFVVLGAGTPVFGAGLGRVAAPRSADPWLVLWRVRRVLPSGCSGLITCCWATRVFAGESWHNQLHAVISGGHIRGDARGSAGVGAPLA